MTWRADVDRRRAQARDEFPRWLAARDAARRSAGSPASSAGSASPSRGWYVDRQAPGRRSRAGAGSSRRLRHAFARARARPTSSSARSSRAARASSRRSWSREFKQLRDRVPPEPFDVVRRVVELDLGRSLDDVFERFERTPIAAASIAQVHAARLRTGEEVVVKVQRPQVARLVREDIRAMSWLAPRLDRPHPGRRAREPARARRAVRGDDRRGARLLPRSAEHARHRARARRDRPARHDRAPPAPDARDATRAR